MKSRRSWLANPWLHVVLIVLVAAFFRLWQIGHIPPGLFGDEATDGLDALDVLAGRGAVFFPANYGREGLHMWIVAGMFRLMGVTPLAMRLPSVMAGILTALATYWLGRELVANRREPTDEHRKSSAIGRLSSFVPLIAALYVATSFWHVHFSRFGIRGVFTPLCGALAFAAFWRAVNYGGGQRDREADVNSSASRHLFTLKRAQGKRLSRTPHHVGGACYYAWFAASGFFLGLATHFYTASRFLPLFLGAFLVLQTIIANGRGWREDAILRRHFWGIVLLYAVAILVFAPLGIYFLQHPGSFTQRASEVIAFGDASLGVHVARAVLANILQFFAPGHGDTAQFYNLPGRAVFDLLTAVLALIGIGILLWRWWHPAALFLLTWWPGLLLPAFLATDRIPTLPRALGVIPGLYFFPAVGVVAVASFISKAVDSIPTKWREEKGRLLPASAAALFCGLAVLIHAGFTYRDYFQVWGPSAVTFDAFEGDMVSAWRWLRANQPVGHVYLSSDIYRHPTFMLLGEQATVQTYFAQRDPDLSWFDARGALPLPPLGQPATYLIGSSAPAADPASEYLTRNGIVRDQVLAPDAKPALTVVELSASPESWFLTARPGPAGRTGEIGSRPIQFTDNLNLMDARVVEAPNGASELRLLWGTTGSDVAEWPGYRLEIATGDRRISVPFDTFRPPEWVPSGGFITWHRLENPGGRLEELGLRLLRADHYEPVTTPEAPDGWHQLADLQRHQ